MKNECNKDSQKPHWDCQKNFPGCIFTDAPFYVEFSYYDQSDVSLSQLLGVVLPKGISKTQGYKLMKKAIKNNQIIK